jgi:methyltransferase of ATP-grasp peptide maturase system
VVTVDVTAVLRIGMVDALIRDVGLPEEWRGPFERVPRHAFLPARYWTFKVDAARREVDRARDPEDWLTTAYADFAAVTQFGGGPIGAPPQPGGDSAPTSSASQPCLVASMLAALEVTDGQRVLEVGTGTGYNAALLAARVGDENVTTIEVDPVVADAAGSALRDAGFHPTVVCGDGSLGYLPAAPYDRVIATCAIRWVPYAWVAQTRPGGMILAPRVTTFLNYGMVRLTVGEDGTASGPFIDPATFMHLRGQRFDAGRLDELITDEETSRDRTTTRDPRTITEDFDAQFALSLQLPEVFHTISHDDEKQVTTVWFVVPDGSSWAAVDIGADADGFGISEQGPRDLWTEVEAAYQWWVDHDSPNWEWFGLTVTPDGQRAWYDAPDSGHTWPVPQPTAALV